MKNLLLTILLIFTFLSCIEAQKKPKATSYWEAGVFLGLATYQGDLASQQFPLSESNFALALSARSSLAENFALRGNLTFTRLSDEDVHEGRGYSFRTSIMELSALGEWEPLEMARHRMGGKKKFFVSPFGYVGAAIAFVNPQALFPEGFKAGDRSPVEQDRINGEGQAKLAIPMGLGVKFDFGQNFILQGETSVRLPFDDYLDGISMSANPDKNDVYWFSGVSLMFTMK